MPAGKRLLCSARHMRGSALRILSMSRMYSDASSTIHVAALRGLIGEEKVITCDMEKYTRDWTGHYSGGSAVAFPICVEEMSSVVKYCHDNDIAMVVQGGNTGLTGGAVGMNKELIISTSKMNQIHALDETSGVLICDAGVILEDANRFVRDYGFMMPIDLGSKASCMLGGNVSSNAGGLKVVKYGSFHANVIGLECVLANGTVLDMLRVVQKDNCGYQLKHIFIGSEGTLGIITKIAIKLFALPSQTSVALVKLSSFNSLPTLLRKARQVLGESLSAFEYMDQNSIDALGDQFPHVVDNLKNSIFRSDSNFSNDSYVLVEVSSSSRDSLSENLNEFLASQMNENVVVDAIVSQDSLQEKGLWNVRELIPVALAHMSHNNLVGGPFLLKYDIAIPFVQAQEVVISIEKYLSQDCGHTILSRDTGVDSKSCSGFLKENKLVDYVISVYCFGHAGDQNLHLNIILRIQTDLTDKEKVDIKHRVKQDLESAVLSETLKLNGSISAEHGIGQQKSHLLDKARTKAEVDVMTMMKQTLDPKNILNPGKILPLHE